MHSVTNVWLSIRSSCVFPCDELASCERSAQERRTQSGAEWTAPPQERQSVKSLLTDAIC